MSTLVQFYGLLWIQALSSFVREVSACINISTSSWISFCSQEIGSNPRGLFKAHLLDRTFLSYFLLVFFKIALSTKLNFFSSWISENDVECKCSASRFCDRANYETLKTIRHRSCSNIFDFSKLLIIFYLWGNSLECCWPWLLFTEVWLQVGQQYVAHLYSWFVSSNILIQHAPYEQLCSGWSYYGTTAGGDQEVGRYRDVSLKL